MERGGAAGAEAPAAPPRLRSITHSAGREFPSLADRPAAHDGAAHHGTNHRPVRCAAPRHNFRVTRPRNLTLGEAVGVPDPQGPLPVVTARNEVLPVRRITDRADGALGRRELFDLFPADRVEEP